MRTNDDKEQFFAKAYHRYARKLEQLSQNPYVEQISS